MDINEEWFDTFPLNYKFASEGQAVVTDINGNSCECTVLDVSVSGMRMHSDTAFTLQEGEAVVLSAPKPPFSKLFPRTDAQVVWVDGKLMGVTYMTRISAAAVEQVVREANIKA